MITSSQSEITIGNKNKFHDLGTARFSPTDCKLHSIHVTGTLCVCVEWGVNRIHYRHITANQSENLKVKGSQQVLPTHTKELKGFKVKCK